MDGVDEMVSQSEETLEPLRIRHHLDPRILPRREAFHAPPLCLASTHPHYHHPHHGDRKQAPLMPQDLCQRGKQGTFRSLLSLLG